MLPALDSLLKKVLLEGVPALAMANTIREDQVSFVAPDSTFQNNAAPGNRPRLSVYLCDLRENLQLRSNERIERVVNEPPKPPVMVTRRMPYRMDCHYLVNAFAAAPTQPSDPPLVHRLLYEATRALVKSQPLVPAKHYPVGSPALNAWPETFRDVELPMTVNPHDGFPKLAEFWGTLDAPHPWHPPVYLVVTVPVDRADAAGTGIVQDMITIYRPGDTDERLRQIAGKVADASGAAVGRALVIAEDGNGGELARTTSVDDGTFVLSLPPAARTLYAAAFGRGLSDRLTLAPTVSEFTLTFR